MCCEKALTYEEAKQLCMKAFDGGVTYGSESMRYGVNAMAYDWEHWLAENERLFKPRPTVEDVLREFADLVRKERVELATIGEDAIDEYASKLRLAEGEDA